MGKTLILTDSACDITAEQERELSCVRVLNLPLFIGGNIMFERADITPDEFYKLLRESDTLPTHAGLNAVDFYEAFEAAAADGYDELVYIGINGKGSSTFNCAVEAKRAFTQSEPDSGLSIALVDSRCYSLGCGIVVALAARMVNAGCGMAEVVSFVTEYIDHRKELVGIYSLEYAKRSGRIGSAAAFVGELLGLRPIMGFPDGENVTYEKVRGTKAIVPRIFDMYQNEVAEGERDYAIIYGDTADEAQELISLIKAAGGCDPLIMAKVGPCVAVNSGPGMLAICFRSKNGGNYTAQVM